MCGSRSTVKTQLRDNRSYRGLGARSALSKQSLGGEWSCYLGFTMLASSELLMMHYVSCSQGYTDLASLGQLPKYTCGQLYYYPAYSHERDATKLQHELSHNLTRTTGALYWLATILRRHPAAGDRCCSRSL